MTRLLRLLLSTLGASGRAASPLRRSLLSALISATMILLAVIYFALWACGHNGDVCSADADCNSGYCVYSEDVAQNVCCNSPCDGATETCNANGRCKDSDQQGCNCTTTGGEPWFAGLAVGALALFGRGRRRPR
jgi:MYXO-CTERM domain-containing protein